MIETTVCLGYMNETESNLISGLAMSLLMTFASESQALKCSTKLYHVGRKLRNCSSLL